MQITATIFEIGGGAAHDGDESLQEVGDGVAVPGDGHGHANAANMVQGRRPRRQLMMVSIQSQHGENLAATEANTAIDDPPPGASPDRCGPSPCARWQAG